MDDSARAIGAAYDAVRYPGTPKPLAHPERLALLARLAGVDVEADGDARVLEIGCGTGANAVWIAHTLPDATVVGVDLSESAIERALALARDAGTPNVRFVAADATRLDLDPFDVVVMHGVYAWVPPAMRAGLLAAIRRLTHPRSVAFVSYNAHPVGWLRMLARDIVRFHVGDEARPAEMMRLAREALPLVRAAMGDADHALALVLDNEIKRLADYPDFLLFHDDLSEHCTPVRFVDFVADAARAGLRHVADAQRVARTDQLPAAFLDRLGSRARDPIALEQYADYVHARSFRQSIVCRTDAPVSRHGGRTDLDDLRAHTELRPETDDPQRIGSPGPMAFTGPSDARITLERVSDKRALAAIARARPGSLPIVAALDGLTDSQRADAVAMLARLFELGLVHFGRASRRCAERLEDAAGVDRFVLATVGDGYAVTPFGRRYELGDAADAARFAAADRVLRGAGPDVAHRGPAARVDAALPHGTLERLLKRGLLERRA